MRLRIIFLTILALLLAACSAGGESDANPNLEETLPAAATDVAATLEPALTTAATDVATVVAPVLTETAFDCESLPEITTEGEDGVTVPENAVAVFQKTGGFAGVEETTTIYQDGHIENNKGETLEAPPEAIALLVSTAVDAGFFDLERSYVPENHCCDFFNYSLTIRDCEKAHTVITADEVPGTPAELWQIIDTVQSLIANTSAALPAAGRIS
jgi:hypothetical protein